jgi:DNA replication and repair protein RecF
VASIERLRIRNLRNLFDAAVALPLGSVWLVGPNGAGKTTVLEAIYVASRGVSFRGRRHGPMTSRGAAGTRLDIWVREGEGVSHHFWRSHRGVTDRGDTPAFSVRLIGSSIHALVEGEPALRRRFIDWNLFHVERRFAGLRSRFRRVAAQRSAWLRAGGTGKPVWDPEYASLIGSIASARRWYFDRLSAALLPIMAGFPALRALSPRWKAEYSEGEEPAALLTAHRERDVVRGYSYLSPARADFCFECADRPWVGSRGENKLVGVLLQIAAERVAVEQGAFGAVWLVDDLQAELDDRTLVALSDLLARGAEQTIFTSLASPRERLPSHCIDAVFHVEQGAILP